MSSINEVIQKILERRAAVPDTRSLVVGVSGIDGCGKGYLARQLEAHLGLQAETTGCPMYENESMSKVWGHSGPFHEIMDKMMPEAESQTLDSYLLSNKTREELKIWNLDIDYVIVRNKDLPDGKFDDFWDSFYKRYPKSPGLVFFSKVGFNDRHDQAFVYVGRSCGGLCGEGDYVLLSKVKGKWEVLAVSALWVS